MEIMTEQGAFLKQLEAIVGAEHIRSDAHGMAPFLNEQRGLFSPQALAVVLPASTQEVAAVVTWATQCRVPLVPQGGNTGLVGAGVPDASGRAVVVSLQRMNRICDVDADNDSLMVEAGVTLHEAQEAARGVNRLFPLSLASEGTCTIGGNIATNAGGTAVLAYGSMRELVLGLEVVLPNGEIWDGLRALRKDNSGYALKHLFIGSEGTLGIVTKAVLRLFAQPRVIEAGWAGVATPQKAVQLFRALKETFGSLLTTAELLPEAGLDMLVRHLPQARMPLRGSHRWHVFFEVSSAADLPLRTALENVLVTEGLCEDVVLAHNEEQRLAFWRLRESMSEIQKCEGASIKHDIAVPLSQLPAMIEEGMAAARMLVPGCRPVPFGHMGDGNLHFNITQPEGMERGAFLEKWDAMNALIHAVVLKYNGSVAAEHGIGRLKAALLQDTKSDTEMGMMRAIKKTFDPHAIMNPCAVILDKESTSG